MSDGSQVGISEGIILGELLLVALSEGKAEGSRVLGMLLGSNEGPKVG